MSAGGDKTKTALSGDILAARRLLRPPPEPGENTCAACLPKYQALMLYARSQRKEKNWFEKSKDAVFVK